MKKLIFILTAGILSSTIVPSMLANTSSNINNNELDINVDNSSFQIGGAITQHYEEVFNLTAHTGVHGWSDFINTYHYFAWAGDKSQSNSWYHSSISNQCYEEGVKNSIIELTNNIPNAFGIPLNNSTHVETKAYSNSFGYWSVVPDYYPRVMSRNPLYYGAYYYYDSSSGDLFFGVSVNAQQATGDYQGIFSFDLGRYASFWS